MSRADVFVGPPADTPLSSTATRRYRQTIRRYLPDGVVYLIYLVGGVFVTGRLWVDPQRRVLSANPTDQTVFDWFLAHGARFVTHGGNPFFNRQLNMPDGVNLAANTSALGLTVPLSPITLAFGPDVAFATLLVLAFAATAGCWYWVLSRTLLPNRLAAFLAAALCGFAPGQVSHANGQPNLVAQFLLPLIIYRVTKLAEPRRAARNGLLLAVLVVWQALVNEELLLFLALGGAVFVAVLAIYRPEEARRHAGPVLGGLLFAGVVSLVLLAYPLWFQFFGPQTYRGLPFDPSRYATDPATYFTFSRESVAGSGGEPPRFVASAAEENGFFGFPLLLLVGIFTGWLWRERIVVRAAAVTAVVFAALAVGARLTVHGVVTGLPGPFALFQHVPVLDLIIPTRFTLVMIPMVALLLGLGLQRAGRLSPRAGSQRRSWLALWAATCVAALLPIVPTPLTAKNRDPVPAFFTTGAWRGYVPAGRTVLAAPAASNLHPDPMWWSATTRNASAIPRGYFLGPTSPTDRQAIFGAPPRRTSALLAAVYDKDTAAVVNAGDRAAARADLAYWRTAVVVLAPGRAEEALWKTLRALLGSAPVFTGGVWLWRVPG